jgi:ABC-type transport system substrate-binding protein
MQYATAAKLYNYRPGGKLVPEVASRFMVSNNGKRYTFFIRTGFRFSDGVPVTASHFEYAINRAATRDLAAPAAQFIADPKAVEIVGAKDVIEGRASRVRGVRVQGNRLIIDVVRASPSFLPTMTMPFFQATSTKLPLDRQVDTVDSTLDLPSAGPYAFTLNKVNLKTSLRRNPYWKPGPGRTAPRNLDGVDVNWNLTEQTAFEQVQRGELDEVNPPPAKVEDLVRRHGVNRARFWVKAGPCVGLIAFNSHSYLFRGNRALRQAVNWAVDRTEYARQAGPYSATPWTHILPPGFLGSITKPSLQPYSTRPNIEKARRLAAGNFREGRITVYYISGPASNVNQYQLVRQALISLGFTSENITARGFSGSQIYTAMSRFGTDADLFVSLGFCHEYADPVGSLIPFGPDWLPDNQKYRDKIARAKPADLGKLDLDIMRNLAPFAVMRTYNDRYFFSDRVDRRSLTYHKAYSGWSIPQLALK